MFQKALITAIAFLIQLSIYAQQGRLEGVVKDELTGETLIGANVLIGPGQGAVTDIYGRFSILADYGTYDLTISYVGYEDIKRRVVLDKKVVTVDRIRMETATLSEVEVVADVARERETPVAFSNVLPAQLEEELASQDLPMVLNTTPGVYATMQGGGDGDARINIRGFSQRNIAVMIDGIPVNDMENGWVYWSNWFGLDAVTRSMQVQRGLGASKIANPAVGGTLNILTKGIDAKKGVRIKQEVGNNNFTRTTLGLTSGKLKNDWGFTAAGSFKKGDGWVEQNFTEGWFYYLKAEKRLGKHLVSLSAMGAPQKHGQRSFRQYIRTYDFDYARSLGDTNATGDAFGDFGHRYNQHWGVVERYTLTDEGDTLHSDQETINTRQNYYHKPQFALRDFWTINDRLYISNVAYLSIGSGGGKRLFDDPGQNQLTDDGQINLQQIYDANTGGFASIDPSLSPNERKSTNYIMASVNNHVWYGLLSTATYKLSELYTLSGGLDLRSYRGEHYREVIDLLGGDYAADEQNGNQTTILKREGDRISYHDFGLVRWAGGFGQIEYSDGVWSGFLSASVINSSYKRIDYFKKKVIEGTDVEVGYSKLTVDGRSGMNPDSVVYNGQLYTPDSDGLEYQNTGWKHIPGFTVKGGANYNINEFHNVFANLGYISRPPQYQNIYDFNNEEFQNIHNEIIRAVEAGYSYSRKKIAVNLNGYYTLWDNRPVNRAVPLYPPDDPEQPIFAQIQGMDARHMGVELDFLAKPIKQIEWEAAISIADWIWNSKEDLTYVDDNGDLLVNEDGEIESFDARGVHVGDAAQSQLSSSLKYKFTKRGYLKGRIIYFDRHYSDFDPFTLTEEDNIGRDSWVIPAYYIVDLHAGYGFKYNGLLFDLRASILNLLDEIFISDASNNFSNLENNPQNFDAASAGVFIGQGRRFNTSLTISF